MQVSLLLAREIVELFLILLMGVAVVRTGLLRASDSKVVSVLLVYLVILWAVGAAGWIPDGKSVLMTVFLATITPACATITSMAQLYDCDVKKSSSLYVLSTLLSLVTMPIMLGLFDTLL